ncbi:MAG: cytochrome C [Candidatus Omnitrophota bacterium]|jgi:cytochrome c|nr:MAG: cytochrome C [Candidatus Omnitrophota bacterium]
MESLSTLPIPKDIPLPLPVESYNLQISIIFLFLLHILFVNLMVGGSLFVVVLEWMGIQKPAYDRLARRIAETITVNKSLAVVLGVGPLLVINVLYTIHFYTANALTGVAWLMVVPVVAIAFLLGYAHKYTWDRLAHQKGLHIAIGAGAALLFLIVPLIFLANINLMLFPSRWTQVGGWVSALAIPNVIPRYLHFLLGSVAVAGLFFAGYFTVREFPEDQIDQLLDRPKVRQMFYSIALAATAANFLAGPLLLFTLPAEGLSWKLAGIISCGVVLAFIVILILWKEIIVPQQTSATRFYWMAALLTGTVVLMATGRHVYRESAISQHRLAMAGETLAYTSMVGIANWRISQGLEMEEGGGARSPGEKVFDNVCAVCHALDKRLVGPPLTEIAQTYPNDVAGIIKWVKNPGRKRADYPQMPAITLTESQHQAVAQYILDLVSGKGQEEEKEGE